MNTTHLAAKRISAAVAAAAALLTAAVGIAIANSGDSAQSLHQAPPPPRIISNHNQVLL